MPSARVVAPILALAFLLPALPVHAAEATARLPGTLPPGLAHARWIGPAPAAMPLHLVVALRAPARAPSMAAWLADRGFAVSSPEPSVLDADGDVAQAQAALGTPIGLYAMPGGATRRAPSADPSLPAALAPDVLGILGLDDIQRLHPMRIAAQRALAAPPADAYSPRDLATAYDLTPLYARGLNGTGQAIAIATAHDFRTSDLRGFEARMGLRNATVKRACVDGACSFDAGAGSDETTLDVEYASGMAPGAALRVFEGAGSDLATFTDVYAKIVASSAKVASTSWGLCETEMSASARAADEQLFARAAAKGQTWLAASGDAGSDDCSGKQGVDYPASSPSVIGVGGTSLACAGAPRCSGPGNETAWSGSGGGVSAVFPRPAWQPGPGAGRQVPDVAMSADPARGSAVAFEGRWYVFGGTSEAAPQWAGLFAILAQQEGGAVGNATARLYALAGSAAFHDVASGCNGAFCARTGADAVTGLGSPDGAMLAHLV